MIAKACKFLTIVTLLCSCSDIEDNVNEDNLEGVLYYWENRDDPICISSENNTLLVENNYSLAERKIEYKCKLSPDSRILITTTIRGINCILDVKNKRIEIDGEKYNAENLVSGHDITFTFEKSYQKQKVQVCSIKGTHEIVLINDGEGGVGKGKVNNSTSEYQMPHGYYKLQLLSGGNIYIESVKVTTPLKELTLLIYGDSITETEVYYPTNLFAYSWVQLLVKAIPQTLSSSLSGCTIKEIMERMKSELPFLDVKYVMITIGTNGGNTVENLSEMVEYIQSLGITPILNHIPCNESGTQVDVNRMIDKIRTKYRISGADFDLATSIGGDGKIFDSTTMFWEDYGPDYILLNHDYWHHPNEKGSYKMFEIICSDLPWLFKIF